jgi:putative hydrolase of the HAD superfamily
MKINTVIFDIGRVLVEFDWQTYLHSFGYEPEKEELIGRAIFHGPYWKEFDRGVWSREQLLDAFLSLAPSCRKEITEVFEHSDRCIGKLPYSKDWIRSLKERGLGVYYLSNYSLWTRERTTDALDFLELTDGGLFSYEAQMVKPDPEIFQELMKRYPEIIPQESVFIDDTAANVETARSLGMQTILFFDYEEACRELEQLLQDENR